MENFNLKELIAATGGEFLLGDPHRAVTRVTTDTRALHRGDFYFAITGRNFDGHDFLKQAIEKGAGGLVVSRNDVDMGAPFPVFPAIVKVKDTFTALGDLAAAYRRKWCVPVVGITGSNGKTTTKEMLASILRQEGKTLATEGNFNNQIGLPLTVLNLAAVHEYAVIEMGSSWPGEIQRLAQIAAPCIGIITNIGCTHLENFKNQEGVFREKQELFSSLPEDGCAVLNRDDPFLNTLSDKLKTEQVTYGLGPDADIHASDIRLWPEFPTFKLHIEGKTFEVKLPVYGKFNIYNALAAAAAAWKLGIDGDFIRNGLEAFTSAKMRMEKHTLMSGATLINDAYNANPSSVRESVEGLVQAYPDREKTVVLGDMLELGADTAKLHRELGEFLALQPLSRIYLYGPLMENAANVLKNASVRYFTKREELEIDLRKSLPDGSVSLFKASRGMRLEEVINNLLDE
jgi:UDP-N-acetylmuramoyl-tripeptide--D-alanyl-D-alanine ligase